MSATRCDAVTAARTISSRSLKNGSGAAWTMPVAFMVKICVLVIQKHVEAMDVVAHVGALLRERVLDHLPTAPFAAHIRTRD
jgi:hypothetical protein